MPFVAGKTIILEARGSATKCPAMISEDAELLVSRWVSAHRPGLKWRPPRPHF